MVLAAVRELRGRRRLGDDTCNYRQLAQAQNVTIASISRAMNHDVTEAAMLQASDGRGRRQRLISEEENLICDAALEFHNNGTPLSRSCVCDLASALITTITPERQQKLGFYQNKPGKKWLSYFLDRHSELTVKRRLSLESARHDAMNPEHIAKHFARLAAVMK